MQIKNSVQRFGWRMQEGHFKANEKDIQAYNEIVSYVKKEEERLLRNNQLFGKMFIYVYMEFIRYYKTTVFDKVPQIELEKILSKSVEALIRDFQDVLNQSEMYYSVEKKDSLKSSVWSYEDVKDNLVSMINNALSTHK